MCVCLFVCPVCIIRSSIREIETRIPNVVLYEFYKTLLNISNMLNPNFAVLNMSYVKLILFIEYIQSGQKLKHHPKCFSSHFFHFLT